MLQSQLFTKTERSVPKDEVAVSAKLLTRAGFVYKNSAGIYTFLPLGWRVIQNVAQIIREEMNAIGGQELQMPALVEKKYLDATGRWDVEISYRVVSHNDNDDDNNKAGHGHRQRSSFVLGWTHEEVLTAIASKYISSYKDLPFAAYQIQTKFRNEPRAKSGLLRGREFMMKDLYSFHASEGDLLRYYDKVADAYRKIFSRCGLKAIYTLAAGGTFTMSNTHEFQVVSDVGEDTIFVCEKCEYAENREISKLKGGSKCPKCSGKILEKKSIEVGNIFPLGTKYSKAFNLQFVDKNGSKKDVIMGSYGIGLGRLMATVVEIYHDDAGIIWPEELAPFSLHLLELNGADAKDIYKSLQKVKINVLYDDRDISAGEKFTDSDLIGIPWRLLTSPRLGDKVEIKKRGDKKSQILDVESALKLLKK